MRVCLILLNFVIAGVVGLSIACFFGKGRPNSPPTEVDNFAQYENIRLPIGGRAERFLKSFIIKVKGEVDDFGRIYVNNHKVTSSEIPTRPFKFIKWRDEKRDFTPKYAVNRASPTDSEVEVRAWLRKGNNWIMMELENSRWGACSMTVELLANGIQLEGSPYFIPQRRQIRESLSNPSLSQRLRRLSADTATSGAFGIIPEYDAVCDRSIFAFQLD